MNGRDDKRFSRGDILDIGWLDTHSNDRLICSDIEHLEEPVPAVACGIVLRSESRHLTIANELSSDPRSGGELDRADTARSDRTNTQAWEENNQVGGGPTMKPCEESKSGFARGRNKARGLLEPAPRWLRLSYSVVKVGGIIGLWLEGKLLGFW